MPLSKKTLMSRTVCWSVMLHPHMLMSVMAGVTLQLGTLKAIASVFDSFSSSWWSVNHRFRSVTQFPIRWAAFSALVGRLRGNSTYSWVSSVYMWYLTPCLANIELIGMQYMVKRRGPRTDPWGTPHSSRWWRETTSPILIASVLSDKYEVSHASADPRIPIEYNCRSSILWSTVSKAAVRSRRTSITPFLRSSACKISSWMRTRVVSVLWRGRYALWNGSGNVFSSM